MTTNFYAILSAACLVITIMETCAVVWACNRAQEATERADVLQRTVTHCNERIEALVADAYETMQSRDDTHAAIMAMPVLSATAALVRVTREVSLN